MQIQVPKCCGKEMQRSVETARFVEVQCGKCGDVVYLRKSDAERPQLLDD